MLIAAGQVSSGCGSGEVTIVFVAPEVAALSPLDQAIAQVVLIRTAPGEPAERVVREVSGPGRGVDLGSIAPGRGIQLGVELRSPTQRLVGYGRSPAMDIGAGERVEVPIQIRRPFVYAAGDTAITTLDATGNASGAASQLDTLGSIDVLTSPIALATSPDGKHIVAITADGTLSLVSTSNHTSVDGEAFPVSQAASNPPSDLAISADGRFAVVGHHTNNGMSGGVSIVDLTAPAASAVFFVALGNVTRVAVGPGPDGLPDGRSDMQAYALLDGGQDCTVMPAMSSTIAAVKLDPPGPANTPVAAGGLISDVAVLGDRGLVGAFPCDSKVSVMKGDGTPGDTLIDATSVTVLAAWPDRMWAVGTLPESGMIGAHLLVLSVDSAGQILARIELPSLQERARTPEFSGSGDEANRQIDADSMAAIDMAALPGDDYVAVMTRGEFHAPPQGDFLGSPVLPDMTLRNHEFLLIDTATTTVVQRVRTMCDLQIGQGIVDQWECTLSSGQQTTERSFPLLGIAALYGAH